MYNKIKSIEFRVKYVHMNIYKWGPRSQRNKYRFVLGNKTFDQSHIFKFIKNLNNFSKSRVIEWVLL